MLMVTRDVMAPVFYCSCSNCVCTATVLVTTNNATNNSEVGPNIFPEW